MFTKGNKKRSVPTKNIAEFNLNFGEDLLVVVSIKQFFFTKVSSFEGNYLYTTSL
jgi:hypothetical protein